MLPEVETLKPANQGETKIIDPSVLVTIAKKMVSKTLVERENEDYRTKDMLCRWRVPNLLNAVTEESFFNMISAALDGQKKTLLNQQPNGRWEPCESEFDIREGREGQPELFMGIRWLDTTGGEDLQYHNGAPVVNVNVKQAPSATDSTLVDAIKLLAQRQIATEDLIGMIKEAKAGTTDTTTEAENTAEIVETVETKPAKATKKRTVKR